jgi:hypothetical protein
LYANLLAFVMDKETAHPGFVETIRNMSADEAELLEYIMKNQVASLVDINRVLLKQEGEVKIHELVSTLGIDASLEHGDLTSSYLINLERLGLVEIPRDGHLTKPDAYDRIVNAPQSKPLLSNLIKVVKSLKVISKSIMLEEPFLAGSLIKHV